MLRLRTQGNPDKASLGTPGVGSQGHLAGTLFQNITGTRFQHVPYRSVSLAMQDLIAGQIDLIFADPSGVAPVQAGSVKAFAVTAGHRLPAVPDVPTAEEKPGSPDSCSRTGMGFSRPRARRR